MRKKRKLDHIDTTQIDLDLDMDTNIVNKKACLSLIMLICLSNALATYEAQFMKKLSTTEAELKKSVPY